MEKYDDDALNEKVFFEGKYRTIGEAGAMLTKKIIEIDLPNTPGFPPGKDPYKLLAGIFGKSTRGISNWSYDWNSQSGAKPTILDFFNLIRLTKSRRILDFFADLTSDQTPYEQAEKYKELLVKIAGEMRNFSETILKLSKNID